MRSAGVGDRLVVPAASSAPLAAPCAPLAAFGAPLAALCSPPSHAAFGAPLAAAFCGDGELLERESARRGNGGEIMRCGSGVFCRF